MRPIHIILILLLLWLVFGCKPIEQSDPTPAGSVQKQSHTRVVMPDGSEYWWQKDHQTHRGFSSLAHCGASCPKCKEAREEMIDEIVKRLQFSLNPNKLYE